VTRWMDGALTGAFDDIAQLTYGEFGEPAAMERLADQIYDRAENASAEPQVTVTTVRQMGVMGVPGVEA